MVKNYYTLVSFLVFGIIGAFSCPGGKSEVQVVEDDLDSHRHVAQDTKTWLDDLKSKWRVQGDSRDVKYYIYDYLDISPNPYLSTLKILANICEVHYTNSDAPLALTVIENLRGWLNIQYDPSSKYLDAETKLAAFRLVRRRNYKLLTKKVAEIYEFNAEPTIFVPSIQSLIRDKKYEEGSRWATFMGLESSFAEPEMLLLPLIVQNKMCAIVDFLRGDRALQKSFVIYMDRLIDTANVSQIFHRFIKGNCTPDEHNSPIKFQAIKRNLYQMVQKYGLSERECPNIYRYRREKMIRYFIQEFRGQRDLCGEVWRGLVRELVGSYVELQSLLVEELISAGKFSEGLSWARYYAIPMDKWHVSSLRSFAPAQVPALERLESSSTHSSSTRTPRTPYPCDLCLGDHYVMMCPTFRMMSLRLRLNFVNYLLLCYNCLGRHLIDECRMKKVCKTCGSKHHTMLHPGPA